MQETYSIGLDFGTLSARAVLVSNQDGSIKAVSVYEYPHGVIDEELPESAVKLPYNYALQDPRDYKDALLSLLREVWRKGSVQAEQVVGIGIDFTSCTILPVDENYVPLCMNPRYADQPHAWVKLWKHHGAQTQADRINRVGAERDENFMKRYGGLTSSEMMFAKILNVLEEAPEIYDAAYRFVEAGDWVVYLLTAQMKKSSCMAGYKAFWSEEDGYPDKAFFAALNPAFENVIDDKIGREVVSLGDRAGRLTEEMSRLTGLTADTCVGVASIDAHTAIPAAGLDREEQILLIMGTSLCQMLITDTPMEVRGINGSVMNGILKGHYCVEAGQTAVGDIYDWFVRHFVPRDYASEAERNGMNLFKLMDEKASTLQTGGSGLLALDWWNGNRSMLADADLTGLILGMTLKTKPEEIYRALIEATAFGCRLIVETLEEKSRKRYEVFACGGLSQKSELVMQIYSDVLGREIRISAAAQTTALGAAIFGAAAAGAAMGGYDTVDDAIPRMSGGVCRIYRPNMENHRIYNNLFDEYRKLHDYFGIEAPIMKRLIEIKRAACQKENPEEA